MLGLKERSPGTTLASSANAFTGPQESQGNRSGRSVKIATPKARNPNLANKGSIRSEGLLIFGASGHARVVHDVARLRGLKVAAFVESAPDKAIFLNLPVLAEITVLDELPGRSVVIGIGDPSHRLAISEQVLDVGAKLTTLIHPDAVIAEDITIGDGSVVFAASVINPGATIGRNVIINTGGIVEHDCLLEDYSQICPGATLGGNVRVGRGGWIGIGATVNQGVSIGDWAMIGAGACVVRDLEDEVIAYGVPAKVARRARYFPESSTTVSRREKGD